MTPIAREKPIIGEIRRPSITSSAFHQFGTTVIPLGRSVSVMLIQRIDPISACELDTGRASHHAQRSQIIADTRIEITRIIPNAVDA